MTEPRKQTAFAMSGLYVGRGDHHEQREPFQVHDDVSLAARHDSVAAKEVLFRLRLMHPEITIAWADSASAGQPVTWTKTYLNLTIKTVSRPKNTPDFVVLPRRWVVERSHAWVMHARRHARDYERLIQHSESLIAWAAIALMTRRITRRSSRRSGQPASCEARRS